ncbi:MAG: tetratricopeptide repeat protein, partial [Deltaproteobacteria bacterium]|nr:tetratricopeptide repeat protein [Deltaproteobacteria bacterium]
MESSEMGRVLDEVHAGGAGVEELGRLASEMSVDDLTVAFGLIRDRFTEVKDPQSAAAWGRVISSLILHYSVENKDAVSGELADMASDILRNDLGDEAAAEAADAVAGVLKLDPVRMARVFDLYEDSLDEAAAVKLLRAITALGDPDETGRFAGKLETLTSVQGGDNDQMKARLDEIRGILDSETGDPNDALRLLERFLDENPTSIDGLRLIARVLIETGRSKKVEAWYVRALGAVEDESARAPLLSDLGFIQLGPLDDVEKALGSFEAALEADRTLEVALTGYLQAMKTLDRVDDAVPLLERIRRETAGQPQEALVLPLLADAYHRLGRTDDAERTWRRLRAIDPRNPAALRFYEEFHERREDYQKLFTTLQFALSVVDDRSEKIRINKKMADVAENRLHNLERALDAYKRVLALDPLDDESRDSVVTLYEKTRKWHALIEFYNEQLRRLPDDEVDQKVEILFKIIEIYQDEDKFPNEDNVLANYARIVEISPSHLEALETLAHGYESRKRWPDLLRVLQKKVSVTDNPEELLDLFHQIAEVAINRMSNETQAIPFLEKILELDPQNLDVVRKLKSIYQRKHNQEKLFAMHLKELEMPEGEDGEPVDRESILASAAAMARDRLLRYEDALRLYEELYELNPESKDARENMHMLYTRLERWADYAAFLRKEVALPMPDKRKMELRHKLGEVLLDRLGDTAAAKDVYEAILRDDPKDDLAARRLENVFLEQEDLVALKEVFIGRDDVRSYVALLAQRESREKDPARKVALNLAMAEACEKDLEDATRASRYLEKAWALDKSLVDVGRKLLKALEEQGNLEGSVNLLKDLAPSLDDPTERLNAWARLHGDLDRLGRNAEAFKAGKEAVRLALSLGQADEHLDALRKTADNGAFWTEYATLLDEVGDATMDHEKRVALLLELGTVYKNRLLFHDEARQALERVLDLDTGNIEALGMLEDIALQREDYVGLESVLRRRIDVAGDPEQVRDIQLRLGRLYEDLLGDDMQAADCYMQVLQTNPDDRDVLGGLHRTYERSEKFMELADVIRMEIKASASKTEAVRLKCELARVCWENLDDFDEALRLLSDVLREDKDSADALNQLKELFERRLAREEAANVLAPFFRTHERFDDLEELLKARLEDMDKPEAKAAIHLEIADIQARIRGDADAGFDSVVQAVDL